MKLMLADCRIRATFDVIRGKWKAIIIKALKYRNLGYGELRRLVPERSHGASPRTGKGSNYISHHIGRKSCPHRIRDHRIRSHPHSRISGHACLGKDTSGSGAWLCKGGR